MGATVLLAFAPPAAAQMQGKACDLSDADRVRAVAQAAEPLIAAKAQVDAMKARQLACGKLEGSNARIACVGANAPTIKPTLQNFLAQVTAFLAEYDRLCAAPPDVAGQPEFIVALVGSRNANPTDGPSPPEPAAPSGIEQPGLPLDGIQIAEGPGTDTGSGGAATTDEPVGGDTGNGGTNVAEGPVTGDEEGGDEGGTTDGGTDQGESSYDPATDPFAPPDYGGDALRPFVPSAEGGQPTPGDGQIGESPLPHSSAPQAADAQPKVCGPDITYNVVAVLKRMKADFDKASGWRHVVSCLNLVTPGPSEWAWDIQELSPATNGGQFNSISGICARPLDSICKTSVTFMGTCQHAQVVNYAQWGMLKALCTTYTSTTLMDAATPIRNGLKDSLPGGWSPTEQQENAAEAGWEIGEQLIRYHGIVDVTGISRRFAARDAALPSAEDGECALTCNLPPKVQKFLDDMVFDYHWSWIHEIR